MLSLAFIIKKRKKKLRLGPYTSAAVTRLIIKQIIIKKLHVLGVELQQRHFLNSCNVKLL